MEELQQQFNNTIVNMPADLQNLLGAYSQVMSLSEKKQLTDEEIIRLKHCMTFVITAGKDYIKTENNGLGR